MSCFSLGKKLRPAKKAWKGFTSILQRNLHKLHKLRRSKSAIKKTTRRLNDALAAALHRSPSFPCRLIQRKIKKPLIARSTISPRKRRKHQTHKQKFAPVYVDELFAAEPIAVQAKHLIDEPTGATVGKLSEKQPQSSSSATEMSTVQQVTTVEMMKPFKTLLLAETSKAATDTMHVIPIGGSGRSVVELKELSRLRGVDERAEEFITKFKEEMRLQNQRSLGEYQEMLARGL